MLYGGIFVNATTNRGEHGSMIEALCHKREVCGVIPD
jgi:hypothetical protein